MIFWSDSTDDRIFQGGEIWWIHSYAFMLIFAGLNIMKDSDTRQTELVWQKLHSNSETANANGWHLGTVPAIAEMHKASFSKSFGEEHRMIGA